jgi:cytochrome P450
VGRAVSSPEVDRLLDELTQRDGRDDPYRRYELLRRRAPVARAPDGAVVLTRYADCHAVQHSPRCGHTDPDAVFGRLGITDWREHPGIRTLSTSMLTVNPPEHTRLRRLVSGAFTARRVAALEPAVIAIVDDLVERLAGSHDFVTDFAFPLPVAVIGELLGVPVADRPAFQPLVRDWTMLLDVFTPDILQRADAAAAQIRAYLGALIEERRRRPGEDLLSGLVTAGTGGDRLSADEVVTMAALLFAAGFETTTHLLANSLVALLGSPEQLALLRRHPELAAGAVEELVRYDSPVQITVREVFEDISSPDLDIAAGERAVLYVGAANRDPVRFRDPDRLDITRAEGPPLSFGGGIHFCLGAPLARLEARIALPAVLRRYRDLALDGVPERRDSLTLRGFVHLPVAAS